MSQWATLTLTLAWVIPLIKQGFSVRFHASSPYWAFQKHANSEAHNYVFCCRQSYNVIMITSSKLWNTETQNGSKSTNLKSQTMTYWTRWSKLLFPKGSAKMMNSSEKSKCQLALELQDLHVYEKRSKPDSLFSSYLRCCNFTSGGSSLPPSLLPVYIIDPSLISLLIFLLWCRDPDNLFCFVCYRL